MSGIQPGASSLQPWAGSEQAAPILCQSNKNKGRGIDHSKTELGIFEKVLEINIMSTLCYINGEILPAGRGAIGISDLALQRGYAVFDYARTYHRELFHFEDHIQRLQRSAAELHLKLPLAVKEIKNIAQNLVQQSDLENPAIRLILTGGYSHAPLYQNPNFLIIVEELSAYPASVYAQGAKLVTVEYQRELPQIKSVNYLNSIRLDPFRREQGAFDILYHSAQGVTECPRSNFFLFLGDTLVTPSSNILLGITREIVLKLAEDHFPLEVREIDFKELSSAGEAFVTSTSKGVLPVTAIDGGLVGDGRVGDRTRTIRRLFEEYTLNC